MEEIIENLKARFKAKRYDIYKEEAVEKGNDGYFLYNDKIYFGNRFGVFFLSGQNAWYQERLFKKAFKN